MKKYIRKESLTMINNKKCKHLFLFKKNAGFTLAEVLITLGIIGVVAAMTIPGLITAYKKQEAATKLEKAISTLNQAIRLSENENGEFETWDRTLPQEEFIKKYLQPYIKIMKFRSPITDCGYKPADAGTDYKVWKTTRGAYVRYYNPNGVGRVPFIAMDGILYTFGYIPATVTADTGNDKIIIIDINASQEPNQFGKDVFFLYRKDEQSIIPYGADKTNEAIKADCSVTGFGYYCAALIKGNGWRIPSDYPWK